MRREDYECPNCSTGVILLEWNAFRVVGRRGLAVEVEVLAPCGECGHEPDTTDEALWDDLIERSML